MLYSQGFTSNVTDKFPYLYSGILVSSSIYQSYREMVRSKNNTSIQPVKIQSCREKSIIIPISNIATSSFYTLENEIRSFSKYQQLRDALTLLLAPGQCPTQFEILCLDVSEDGIHQGVCIKATPIPNRWYHRLMKRDQHIKVKMIASISIINTC